ncbi:MAG: hypothetical protein IT225_00180 [Flavobacteriales bacterium]|nr:hypothetical protein [Flavobacteriales bacterium]
MMRPLSFVLVLLQAAAAAAQIVGNEWIDHDRRYWRFDVYSTGLHRLDSATLAASGFPVASVDPADLMLFGREKQVPIYIEGGDDGVLNAGDFIEFIGRKNDGWIDERMYDSPYYHTNPHYSLINDTIHYFLTWDADPGVLKERVQVYTDPDVASHTIRPWVWGRGLNGYGDNYWYGLLLPPYNYTSGMMMPGEGFGGPGLIVTDATSTADLYAATPQAFTGPDAPDARVRVTTAGQDLNAYALPDHHLRLLTGPQQTVRKDTIFLGNKVIRSDFAVPAAEISPFFTVTMQVLHDLPLGQSISDYMDFQVGIALDVTYPRDLNGIGAGPYDLWIPHDPNDPIARLQFGGAASTPILYTFGDVPRRVVPAQNGANWELAVPTHPDSLRTPAYLHTEAAVIPVGPLTPVNGSGYFTDHVALGLDSAMVIVSHRSLWNGATAYAAYRSTQAPRPVPVVLADIDELYDQYGGGVPKHPLAIRSFMRDLVTSWDQAPQGLFLIGKSTSSFTTFYEQGARPDVNGAYARMLVPSYGAPACDQCFTIAIGPTADPRRVEVPVGRLSAVNEQQVFDYLDKVSTLEGQAPAAWMKNVVHLSGGFTAAEQESLANRLRFMEPMLGDTSLFGAQFWRFKKSSSSIFSTAAADSVRNLIESGVTLLNFFAHAYSESFDITIDDPDNYEWNGRYPFVIGNSCYIGNVHLNDEGASTSEDWVMRQASGPVAFMATTKVGVDIDLALYGQWLYQSIGGPNYGKPYGKHMQHAAYNLLSNNNNWGTIHTVHTFTLQGDPMLVMNSPLQPDLEVRPEDVLFEPTNVTADVDTFTVKVAVRNLGRMYPGQVGVQLQRSNPGLAATGIYAGQMTGMGFCDTISFRVPTLAFSGGQGVNQFTVRVDLDPDLIAELSPEIGANQASTTLFITSGDLVPIYPYDFAILPDPQPALRASTGDPLAAERTYIFQIDTTDLFNSPVLESTTITAPGGVVTWQPQSIYALNGAQDSTVFFWRCSIDSTGNGGYNWYERSFQFIEGQYGWGQAHFFQFKNDTYNSIIHDRPERDFDFSVAPHEITGFTSSNPYGDIGWRLDLVNQDYGGCWGDPAWNIAVIDPYTFEAWETRFVDTAPDPDVVLNPDHDFGNFMPCGNHGRPRVFFHFRQNSATEMTAMANMLNERIPDGYHILAYTWFYMDQDGMSGTPAIAALNNLGVPSFATLQDSVPYIFYVRKGVSGTFVDTIAATQTTDISLTAYAASAGDRGTIATMEAGPALAWHGLYWHDRPVDPTDSTVIQIQGITNNGLTVELGEWPDEQGEFLDLGALADATVYPKLRIRGKFHDIGAAEPVPAQMDRWQLLHSPVPECAIDPQLGLHTSIEGLFQGQEAAVSVAIHNISPHDMDSLLVAAWVINGSNQRHRVWYKRNAPLAAGAVLLDTIRFSTWGFGGINTLVVEANPVDTLTGVYDQPEQHHFNNLAQWRFDVAIDRENPLLDVTFDGIHILDGDIVSARPEVEISLNDENTILLLDSPADTAQFKVFLTRPGRPIERIHFRDGQGNEVLQFIPADGPENEARILYRPRFAVDGKYLLTVQAMDLSRNASGDNDYKVSFEVINRSTITEVLNYPNPFTTSTRFVFTLTGSTVPSYMKIQIMTVSGRVVREVGMHELGPLHVGRNITEFAWDGTDEFGDKLARGVYLYRVITRINGEDVEYRATDAASYFTKGFGKMYKL